MTREVPYGAFNFTVKFDGGEIFGGFSEVSGLGLEITVAEYRNGNEPENHVRKIPGISKSSDVTLKRGVIDSSTLWEWINAVRTGGPNGMIDTVTITLQDEAHEDRQVWTLRKAIPMKYTGAPLDAAKSDAVAVEELVLATESTRIGE